TWMRLVDNLVLGVVDTLDEIGFPSHTFAGKGAVGGRNLLQGRLKRAEIGGWKIRNIAGKAGQGPQRAYLVERGQFANTNRHRVPRENQAVASRAQSPVPTVRIARIPSGGGCNLAALDWPIIDRRSRHDATRKGDGVDKWLECAAHLASSLIGPVKLAVP